MEKNNIYQKLLEVQKKNLTFTKNAENPFFKSKYLTLDDLNKGLIPTLNELGLVIYHRTDERNVITIVIDSETSDFIESKFPIPETIIDPQKMGSAITYAKRYNIGQLFNIITDEDDDANATKPKKRGYRYKDGKEYKLDNNPKRPIEPVGEYGEPVNEPFPDRPKNQQRSTAGNPITYKCADCKTDITKAEQDYSKTNYGMILCRTCQKKYKKKQ